MKKKKRKSPHPLLDGFDEAFAKSALKERDRVAGLPRRHDVSKGEFARDVDPADADGHLK